MFFGLEHQWVGGVGGDLVVGGGGVVVVVVVGEELGRSKHFGIQSSRPPSVSF